MYLLIEFILKKCPDQILENLVFYYLISPVEFTYNITFQTLNRGIQMYNIGIFSLKKKNPSWGKYPLCSSVLLPETLNMLLWHR